MGSAFEGERSLFFDGTAVPRPFYRIELFIEWEARDGH
jgi:hypothetical protein